MVAHSNRWRAMVNAARENYGMDRGIVADALGISRGRLNDLVLNRATPRPAEVLALEGKRRASYIIWKDADGNHHSIYTGRGKNFEDLVSSPEGHIDTIIDELTQAENYAQFAEWVEIQNRYPKSSGVRVWSGSATLRHQLPYRTKAEREASRQRIIERRKQYRE